MKTSKIIMLFTLIFVLFAFIGEISYAKNMHKNKQEQEQQFFYELDFTHSYFLVHIFKSLKYEKKSYLRRAYNKEQKVMIDKLLKEKYLITDLNGGIVLAPKGIIYVQIDLLNLDKEEI